MPRNNRRVVVASLVVGLGLGGAAGARAEDDSGFAHIFAQDDVQRVLSDDLPVITGDIESGLGGLGDLLGEGGLLGGILGGTDDLVGGVLGGLGLGSDPELEIQPVPSGEDSFEDPNVAGGLLDNLFSINSIADSLAGRL